MARPRPPKTAFQVQASNPQGTYDPLTGAIFGEAAARRAAKRVEKDLQKQARNQSRRLMKEAKAALKIPKVRIRKSKFGAGGAPGGGWGFDFS